MVNVLNCENIINTFKKEFNLESWDYIELPFNTCSLLKINNTVYPLIEDWFDVGNISDLNKFKKNLKIS